MSKKLLRTVAKVATVVAGIAAIGTGIGAVLGGTMMLTVLGTSIAASSIAALAGLVAAGAGMLIGKPKALPQDTLARLNANFDLQAPRKLALGETALATDIRYQSYTGTEQEYLHWVVGCASHAVDSIDQIWFDSELAWSVGGGVTTKYAGYLTVTPRLEGAAGNAIAIDSAWTSNSRLTGCAYVYMRFKLTGNTSKTQSPFAQSIPTRMTIIGKGLKCYDPRLDSTNGGSGSHRPDDQATWAFSRNPALQLLTYLLGWKVNGKVSVGRGSPVSRLDLNSFITAANLCDEPVTRAIGGTEPRYRADGILSEGDAPNAVIANLGVAMNAVLRDAGGRLALHVIHNDLAVPKVNFTEADIIEGAGTWRQTSPLSDSFNIVRGRYVDPSAEALFQLVDYPEVYLESVDGVDRIDNLDLALVQSPSQAQRLAKQRLQRSQYQGTYTVNVNARGWQVNLGDVVTFSHAYAGWEDKLFRVVSHGISVNGQVPLLLVEEHTSIYAWDQDENPAVVPAVPTTYDPLLHPLYTQINELNESVLNPRGVYDPLATYEFGDVVHWAIADGGDGSSYVRIGSGPTTGVAPSNTTWWALFVASSGEPGPEGPQGPPGADGQDGIDAVSADLLPETRQVFAYANGVVANYTGISTEMRLTLGNTNVSSSFVLSIVSNPQALTTSISGRTVTITGAGSSAGQFGHTAVENAVLVIRASGSGALAGVVLDKIFTLSKLKGGYEIVTSLPATNLFEGRVVFLTTDDKLYRYTGSAWTAAVPSADITGQLADAQIAALAASKITGQMTNAQLADLAATKITGQLTNAQIAALAATKITGQLTDAQIAAVAATKVTGQITATQITDGAVTTPKLAAGSVVAGKIAAFTITASEIATDAVTAAKIVAGAVTTAKIAAGAVVADTIASNAITSAKISAGAVVTAKLAASAVTANEIASNAITAVKISAGAVEAAKIAAGAVVAGKIAANAVTANEIAANSIVAAKIATNAVTADKVDAGAITTAKLAANAVTAIKIDVANLSAITADMGTITSGLMQSTGGLTKIDLNNARAEWVGGTYKLVQGAAFGVSSNLVLWYGPNAVAPTSATIANSVFALATDGMVYLGGAYAMPSFQTKTLTMPTSGSGSTYQVISPVFTITADATSVSMTNSGIVYEWNNSDQVGPQLQWQYSANGSTWTDVTTTTTARRTDNGATGGSGDPIVGQTSVYSIATKTGLTVGQKAYFRLMFRQLGAGSWTYFLTAGTGTVG